MHFIKRSYPNKAIGITTLSLIHNKFGHLHKKNTTTHELSDNFNKYTIKADSSNFQGGMFTLKPIVKRS